MYQNYVFFFVKFAFPPGRPNKNMNSSQLLGEIRALKLELLQKHNETIDKIIEKIENNSTDNEKIQEIVSQYDFLLQFMSKNDFQKKILDDIQ